MYSTYHISNPPLRASVPPCRRTGISPPSPFSPTMYSVDRPLTPLHTPSDAYICTCIHARVPSCPSSCPLFRSSQSAVRRKQSTSSRVLIALHIPITTTGIYIYNMDGLIIHFLQFTNSVDRVRGWGGLVNRDY